MRQSGGERVTPACEGPLVAIGGDHQEADPLKDEAAGDGAEAAALREELARQKESTRRIVSDAVQTLENRILASLAVLVRTRTWRLAQSLDRSYYRHSRPDISDRLTVLTSAVQKLAAVSTAPSADVDTIRASVNAFQNALRALVLSKPLLAARKISAFL